ncbi:DNA topoisomerase 2-binding protein 1 [Porphyridium purpureum]|uniref:DNA topoisomerase 2-binding protein 1 n=1 Tax=Porphyridium purpureum TaxID=35688 RepID=A0A5J4YN82_PORPP|nr:DNA topoisomerase 2-binding protein 1 [Porphyridium purpureum]|eukprot:POR8042..scf295_9
MADGLLENALILVAAHAADAALQARVVQAVRGAGLACCEWSAPQLHEAHELGTPVVLVASRRDVERLRSSDAWETYGEELVRRRARFVHPELVLMCLQHAQTIPTHVQSFSPLSSAASSGAGAGAETRGAPYVVIESLVLRDCVLCTTGFNRRETSTLELMALSLGAAVERSLSNLVTHLVAERAGSAKHRYATQHNLPSVTPAWIEAVHEQRCLVELDGYRTPLMGSFVVCCGPSATRDFVSRIRQKVERMGALFLEATQRAALLRNSVTHVVLMPRQSSAEVAGQLPNIHIVMEEWVNECERQGRLLDEHQFGPLSAGDRAVKLPSASDGAAAGQLAPDATAKGSSEATLLGKDGVCGMENTGILPTLCNEKRRAPLVAANEEQIYMHLSRFDGVFSHRPVPLFMDQVVVFFLDVPSEPIKQHLTRLLHQAGGLVQRTSDSRMITHIVFCGSMSPVMELKEIKQSYASLMASTHASVSELMSANGALFVSLLWLLECFEHGKLLAPCGFEVSLPPLPAAAAAAANMSSPSLSEGLGFVKEKTAYGTLRVALNAGMNLARLTEDVGQHENASIAKSDIFRGLRFDLGPLMEINRSLAETARREILACGGRVLCLHSDSLRLKSGVPTHVLWPTVRRAEQEERLLRKHDGQDHGASAIQIGSLSRSRSRSKPEFEDCVSAEVEGEDGAASGLAVGSSRGLISVPADITVSWIEACLKEMRVLNADACILYQPLPPPAVEEFRSLVLCLTGFSSKSASNQNQQRNWRRKTLTSCITLLGAGYSEDLLRSKTTHLICDSAYLSAEKPSDKLKRAREWGINVVNVDWLLCSARAGRPLPSESFKSALVMSTPSERRQGVAEGDTVGAISQHGRPATVLSRETPQSASLRAADLVSFFGKRTRDAAPPTPTDDERPNNPLHAESKSKEASVRASLAKRNANISGVGSNREKRQRASTAPATVGQWHDEHNDSDDHFEDEHNERNPFGDAVASQEYIVFKNDANAFFSTLKFTANQDGERGSSRSMDAECQREHLESDLYAPGTKAAANAIENVSAAKTSNANSQAKNQDTAGGDLRGPMASSRPRRAAATRSRR